MKFYESTSFFMRVVVVNYHSRKMNKSIKLMPMFHIGEYQFYETMLKEANQCEVILLEGISLNKKRINKQVGRYTNIARKLNLASQYEFFRNNKFASQTIHADLKGEEAKRAWNDLRIREKIKYRIINPIKFQIETANLTRKKLSKAFMSSAEDDYLAYGPVEKEGNLEYLTHAVRDNIVIKKIEETIYNPKYERVGVMFGAGHMRAIEKYLTMKMDFSIKESKFVKVYNL